MIRRLLHGATIIYILACAFSIWVIFASLYGWAGVESDPLSAVFAYLLSLPWVLVLTLLPEMSTLMAALVSIAGMAINAAILLLLARRFDNRRSDRQ